MAVYYRAIIAAGLTMALMITGCPHMTMASEWKLPADHRIEWDAGVRGGIPTVKVAQTAELPKGGKDASAALQKAIDSIKAPVAILIPEGEYTLKKKVLLRSGVVLRGAGVEKTKLVFDVRTFTLKDYIANKAKYNADVKNFGINEPNKGALRIAGTMLPQNARKVASDLKAGATTIPLESTGGLKAGQTIWLFQDNDGSRMGYGQNFDAVKKDWGLRSFGQVLSIKKVGAKAIEVDAPLHIRFDKKFDPRVMPMKAIENVGLESLTLTRRDKSFENLVDITFGVNCWIKDVEFSYVRRVHLSIARSRFITVTGNYLHHAWFYGGGGSGYGVILKDNASDCLIENNVFHTLRHAMMVKQGANGNVFAYNYSIVNQNQHRYGNMNRGYADISGHGHFPNWNLFEGNDVQIIGEDAYWGTSGPGQTYFRNRIRKNAKQFTQPHAGLFVGNSCMGHMKVPGHFLKGANLNGKNFVADQMTEGQSLPASLYYPKKPGFWPETTPWPVIGADVDVLNMKSLGQLPAQDRYEQKLLPRPGTTFLACFLKYLPQIDKEAAQPIGDDGSIIVNPNKPKAFKKYGLWAQAYFPKAGEYTISVRAKCGENGKGIGLVVEDGKGNWKEPRNVTMVEGTEWKDYPFKMKFKAGAQWFSPVVMGNRTSFMQKKPAPDTQRLHILSIGIAE